MSTTARLHSNLLNTPHLCTASALDSAINYLDARSEGRDYSLSSFAQKESTQRIRFDAVNKVGFLEIRGSLVYKHSLLSAACGMISYQSIEKEFRHLLDSGAKTVVLIIDSPGGVAYSAFETASQLRKMADTKGVKIISYVDGIACSAAYVLASASHQIIANPMSEVGSIGVVVRLQNNSGAEKKAGKKTTYIYAGSSKVPFSADGSFSQSFLDDVQSKVQSLYESFCVFVATYRKLSVKAITNTQAKTFLASDAVKIGLVDRVMNRTEFESYIVNGSVSTESAITQAAPKTAAATQPKIEQKRDSVQSILKSMFPERKQYR